MYVTITHGWINYNKNLFIMGATWFRRGLQNQRCMPRMRTLVNQTQLNINANDKNFAGEAIAA